MKTSTAVIAGLAAILVIAFAIFFIDIDQTEEGALPDVDVSVEGGNLPKFDAETGSVNVTVPGVEVTPPSND